MFSPNLFDTTFCFFLSSETDTCWWWTQIVLFFHHPPFFTVYVDALSPTLFILSLQPSSRFWFSSLILYQLPYLSYFLTHHLPRAISEAWSYLLAVILARPTLSVAMGHSSSSAIRANLGWSKIIIACGTTDAMPSCGTQGHQHLLFGSQPWVWEPLPYGLCSWNQSNPWREDLCAEMSVCNNCRCGTTWWDFVFITRAICSWMCLFW